MVDINIIQASLTEAKAALERIASPEKTFIVFDENVAELVAALGLPAAGTLGISATEEDKSLGTVMEIDRWLMDMGANRDAFVLGVGGGITTDMVGFAASIYKRGVRFAFIPTTLLSQVDAAIGGKNGVNLDNYKNMIGVIRQPEVTLICPEALQSLPERQIVNGAAELLKTFIISNENDNYRKATEALSGDIDYSSLSCLVAEAAKVKAFIAGKDPYEKGQRRLLNLGHTFAHAIEKESGETIPHGEAVAIGIILAARLAERLELAENGLEDRLRKDFLACGLPVDCPYGVDVLADSMGKDKKAEGGIVHFVLPLAVGKVETRDLSVAEVVEKL